MIFYSGVLKAATRERLHLRLCLLYANYFYPHTFKSCSLLVKFLFRCITPLTNIHDRFLITVLNEYILTNAQILLNYLENLENAISFAQLNVVHHSILKNADLEIILEKLNLLYNQKQLAKFGYLQSHRDFYGVQLIRNTNELIFNIKIPILSQETYNLYRLYPIPIQNLTFIPEKPILLIGTNSHISLLNPCPTIEDQNFCQGSPLPNENKCLPNLVHNEDLSQCKLVPVYLQEDIVEQITTNLVLI